MPATGATRLKSTCDATKRTCQLLTKEYRKRAPRACLQCRRRKVRCDVAFSGLPCRNCVLDNIGCVVTERKLKGKNVSTDEFGNIVSASAILLPPVRNDGEQAENLIDGEPNCVDAPSMGDMAASTTGDLCDGTYPLASHSAPTISPSMDGLEFLKSTDSHLEDRPFYRELFLDREMFLGGDCVSLYQNDDSYASDLPFINLPDLSRLSLHEISSLRLQKCLWLPPKLILDEFVRQYFLNVHPVVPFLDEKHFWDLYGRKNVYDNIPDKIPMVLFQAMLFSACSFVSQPIVEALGFSCLRSASAKLYIRAKILYDMRTEYSSLVLAQTAILLTFLPFSYGVGPTRPNTMWLRTAIEHTRSAHTDHVMSSRGVSYDRNNQIKQASSLKRLWWCCILRDKTLSLGLQRSIQITQSCRPPELSDFEDEIGSSLVYDSHTQRRLYSIFIRTMELCTVLTDLLPLVCQSEDDVYSGHALKSSEQAKLVICKSALENWYLKTQQDHSLSRGADGFQHQSVIIQTTFMYIFYHTARLSLHSKDILVTLLLSKKESLSSLKVLEKSLEARDAAISITDCLRESVQLGIVRYFPISIVSFIAIPLLMHILDHKIQHRGDRSQKAVASHHRLQALIHAMKQYRLQYHGVESISEVLRLVVDFAEPDYQVKPLGTTSEWTDVITCRPSQFIQLTTILKASLSQAKLPNQVFQQSLKNILTSVPTLTDSLYSVSNMQDFDVFPLAPASDAEAGTTSSPTATDMSNHNVPVMFDDFFADEQYSSHTEIEYPGRTADAPLEVRESPDIVDPQDTGNRSSISGSSITPGVLDFINAISCFDQDSRS